MYTPRLFPAPPVPSDPNVRPADTARLSRQCERILDLLRRGPQSNADLAAVSLKYTGRISDLRAAGYAVECTRGAGGVNTYRLVRP